MRDELLAAWAKQNRAIGAVAVNQSAQITEAAAELEMARKRYGSLLMATAHQALLKR